jgi:hypothetical protein
MALEFTRRNSADQDKRLAADKITSAGLDFYIPRVKLGAGDLATDAWGAQKVSLPFSLFHGMFTFDIPESKWMMYENDVQVYSSTRIVALEGSAKLTTSVSVTDVVMESRVCPRYQPNRGHLFSTAVWCPSKTAGGIREWGVGTVDNQVVFRLKSDGKLYAAITSGGVDTYEQEIVTAGLTGFDVEKNNIYDIQFQWRSAGNYNFYIGDPATGQLTLVHTINYLGTLTRTSIENPALPAHFHCERTTEDVELRIGCVDITSENGFSDDLEYGSAYASGVAVTTDTPVIVVKQPLTIGSEINTRDLQLARISFNCSKKAVFKVWKTRDSTGITGATYKVVNSGSYVETDSTDMDATAVRATSVTLNKLRVITAVPVEALVPRQVDNPSASILFPIVRGDYLVVTCTAATATADVVVEWGEHI